MTNDVFYNVALSYDYSTLSLGVMATDEEQAEIEALRIFTEEWGAGVADYSSCDVTIID